MQFNTSTVWGTVLLAILSLFGRPHSDRVAEAYRTRWAAVSAKMKEAGINPNAPFDLHIRAYKKDMELEVWAKQRGSAAWNKVTTYPFCAYSGMLGPKRYDGDCQVPEGFYSVHHLIPNSQFHLSIYLSYPNASDKIRGDKDFLGKDICIHGSCTSVGCISIMDDIKDVYILTDKAMKTGQRQIPVHIYPTRLAQTEVSEVVKLNPAFTAHAGLWQELQAEEKAFAANKSIPSYTIDPTSGAYIIK